MQILNLHMCACIFVRLHFFIFYSVLMVMLSCRIQSAVWSSAFYFYLLLFFGLFCLVFFLFFVFSSFSLSLYICNVFIFDIL